VRTEAPIGRRIEERALQERDDLLRLQRLREVVGAHADLLAPADVGRDALRELDRGRVALFAERGQRAEGVERGGSLAAAERDERFRLDLERPAAARLGRRRISSGSVRLGARRDRGGGRRRFAAAWRRARRKGGEFALGR